MTISELWPYSGLAASIWLVIGVAVAGAKYEGYSHTRQFCSELGAAGSPTERFSPIINNYPLGLLFVLFGVYLASEADALLMSSIGWLIVTHGVGTWVAGYFPMDADPYTPSPTRACKIHGLAGVVMLLSLIVAPVLSLFSSEFSVAFKGFSVVCLAATLIFTATLAGAFKKQSNPGLHQRLSYGAQLLWLAGLSLVVA
ncbi:DUF998 domain-containing protein [Pseudomaricurvus alkylphenolicus]|uniref:DUF998 domain-containing protein n=1 Tax=Pseudomaricurvus alkylphenolicus TaxID=1306991 RepID=UPI00141EA8ED|nr:DUF998 domain-containing protein [Pseudomaricurvus alkylphenolicus]NIB38651.1 DUF998 domain-containing protein [Pseudomaricurvus alkylphenolicus]